MKNKISRQKQSTRKGGRKAVLNGADFAPARGVRLPQGYDSYSLTFGHGKHSPGGDKAPTPPHRAQMRF